MEPTSCKSTIDALFDRINELNRSNGDKAQLSISNTGGLWRISLSSKPFSISEGWVDLYLGAASVLQRLNAALPKPPEPATELSPEIRRLIAEESARWARKFELILKERGLNLVEAGIISPKTINPTL